MRSSRLFLVLVATIVVLYSIGARADGVDMNDPRRALGREDDVRVDAQLFQDTVSSTSPLSVRYQIQNFSNEPVAVADKIVDLSYDVDSQTITMSIGAEVPKSGTMPHLVVIPPGEKKVLSSGGTVHVAVPNIRSPFVAVPRLVQIKVNVLRDVAPFAELIESQSRTAVPQRLSDQQFDRWVEANDAIFLNAIPVHWQAGNRSVMPAADRSF